jgi:DNA-directed RNA polymerase subunit RPC12/RpoP
MASWILSCKRCSHRTVTYKSECIATCQQFPLHSRWCTPLASWALYCANCGKNFELSKIKDTLANFFLPEKPEFPPSGMAFECPNCKNKATYRSVDLVYRP